MMAKSRICNNSKCDMYNQRIKTATTVCRNCQQPLVDAPRLGKKYPWVFLVLVVLVAGGVAWWFYPNAVKTLVDNFVAKYFPPETTGPPTAPPTANTSTKDAREVPGSRKEITSPSPSTSVSTSNPVEQDIKTLLAEFKIFKEKLEQPKPDYSKSRELVKIMERLDAIEKLVKTVSEEVATKVEKQLKTIKPDIISAVHIKIQEEVKQLQIHISEANLAQFKQMFAELNVKLDKRNPNEAEVKQAIDELQSKLDSQFVATLAEIRQLIDSSPVREEIKALQQDVGITRAVQLKQIADTFVLKAENNVIKQMFEEFAQRLTVLPFAVEEKQYPRLGLKIDYFYYQRKDQGIPQPLTNNTVLLKGNEFYVVFTSDQESYVYIFQKDVLGKCYLLYPSPDYNINPVQPKHNYEIPNGMKERFVVKDEKPGVETIFFQVTRQRHPKLEKISGKKKESESPINPEYCHPPATLSLKASVSGRGQLLCEDCAAVLTYIYKQP